MNKPNKQQIADEIAALKKMKPSVRHYSAFGDDNRAAISAQINVLETGMDEDGVLDNYDDAEDNVRDSALEAWAWAEGDSIDGAPSENWKSLCG